MISKFLQILGLQPRLSKVFSQCIFNDVSMFLLCKSYYERGILRKTDGHDQILIGHIFRVEFSKNSYGKSQRILNGNSQIIIMGTREVPLMGTYIFVQILGL